MKKIYQSKRPDVRRLLVTIYKFLQMIHLPSICFLGIVMVTPYIYTHKLSIYVFMQITPFLLAVIGCFAWNAYYDLERDRINKPYRLLPMGLMRPITVIVFASTVDLFALIMAVIISTNWAELLLYLLAIFLAAFYNFVVAHFAFLKTLYTAMTISIPYFFLQLQFHIEEASFLKLLLSIILYINGKELLMDVMDYDGDKASKILTIPILIGKRKTTILMVALMTSGIVFISSILWKNTLIVLSAVAIYGTALAFWFSQSRLCMRISMYLLWFPLLIGMISFWFFSL